MQIAHDPDTNVILVDANDFDPEAFDDFLAALAQACSGNAFNILIDRASPQTDAISWQVIQGAGSLLPQLAFLKGRRIAGVLPGGVRYAVARQIAAIASALNVAEYRPFTSRRAALAWLHDQEGAPL